MARFKMVVAAHLFLFKEDKVLLARRFNTGYQDGNFSVPAGHLDGQEAATDAAIREAKEEAGIVILPKDLHFLHVMHRIHGKDSLARESIDFFFTCSKWQGQPQICEPDKCDLVEWFPLKKLPQNIIPYIRQALELSLEKIPFSQLDQ